MLKKRIIPCLDIKEAKVVKGVNFNNLSYIGNPVEYAKIYERQCADEIVFLDITASFENRNITKEIITKGANNLSIPLTVGGGIRNIEDFREILKCGADKVSINSAAVKNPEIIKIAANEFGVQCVVVAIDGKRDENGDFKVFIKGGRENTGLDLLDWAKQCERIGAGEILLTSMDADGTKSGYDIEMTKFVCENVNIPVIASGGCGKIQDIVDVFKETNCDAALIASILHYGETTIEEIKRELYKKNINVRRLTNN